MKDIFNYWYYDETLTSSGMPTAEQVKLIAEAGVQLVINLISIVTGWLYYALLESSSWQGTVGKKVLGIRVTDMNGNQISFGRATGRYFGLLLSGLICFIGFIMVAFTEKKQGLHDMLASTLVLKGPAVPSYVAPPPPPDFSYRGGGPSNFQ